MEETRDGRAGLSTGRPERAEAAEAAHGVPGVFGALLDEALGSGHERVAAAEPACRPASAVAAEDPAVPDSSLVVAVGGRPVVDARPDPGPHMVAPGLGATEELDVPHPVEAAQTIDSPTGAAVGSGDPDEARPAARTPHPAGAGTLRPTIVDGRVELDAEWLDWPLLRQPVVLRPGASVGPPDGGSYVANPGSIPVTFVPAGLSGDPAVGSYFVDPAEVAAAAGPGGRLTAELMAHLSGRPYRAGPPTAIQLAILDAARQAGLRLDSSS